MTNRAAGRASNGGMVLLLSLASAVAAPCTVSGTDVEAGELWLPGGAAFGYAAAAPRAEVTFDQGATAVLSGDGITLRVELVASELEVHPRREVRLAPWLVAGERASLVPGEGRDGRLTVGVTREQLGGIGVVREEGVEVAVPCEAFTLTPADWDPYDPGPGRGRRVQLTAEDGLASLRDDDGEPVAELRSGFVGKVLEASGDEVRIRVGTWGFEVTGWIDAADASPYDPGRGGLGMRGSGGGACGLFLAEPRTCDEALPLLVRTVGGVVEVGEMAPGTPYIVLDGAGDHVPVVIPDGWFVVYDGFETTRTGAELVVPAGTCAPGR